VNLQEPQEFRVRPEVPGKPALPGLLAPPEVRDPVDRPDQEVHQVLPERLELPVPADLAVHLVRQAQQEAREQPVPPGQQAPQENVVHVAGLTNARIVTTKTAIQAIAISARNNATTAITTKTTTARDRAIIATIPNATTTIAIIAIINTVT
jgi:hypothetical protein